MNKLKYTFLPLAAFCFLLAGCAAKAAGAGAVSQEEIAVVTPVGTAAALDLSAPELTGGVSVSKDTLTIEKAGVYRLTGSLNGRLCVDADGPVELVLAGASITGTECISVVSDDAVALIAEADTVNILSDGTDEADKNASAAVYSKAPLTIGGDGTILVLAGGNNGIQVKGDLSVTGGSLHVTAENHALKCEGTLTIAGGYTDLICGGDGLNVKAGRTTAGNAVVSGGHLSITAGSRGIDADDSAGITGGIVVIDSGEDGIRAADVSVTGGDTTVTTRHETPEDDSGTDDTSDTPAAGTEAETSGDGLQGGTVTVSGGIVTIDAADEAIQADVSIAVSGGELRLTAGSNGLSSDGDISIEEGVLSLTSGGDGIQAVSLLSVSGGTLDITTGKGGGSAINHAGDSFGPFGGGRNNTSSSISTKGLKSDGDITVSGGTLTLNTEDDSIHCAGLCSIEGGSITICASDDAIHADDWLYIHDGTVNILDCFEGLEAFSINVAGGDVIIRAVNDGINANGSEWGNSGFTSRSGQSNTYFCQTGGKIDLVVTGNSGNMGDGVDSNGSVYIFGGELVVSTYGGFMENGIDYGWGYFLINGGKIMAGGSSTMAESPSSASEQCCARINPGFSLPAGTVVTLLDSEGNEIWSNVMANLFTSIIVSHPDMTVGNTYILRMGDTDITMDFTDSNVFSYSTGGGRGGFGGGGPGGRPF